MDITRKSDSDGKKLNLVCLVVCVLAVKLAIFLIDPTVMFFIGDSARYIDTAISSYIPPDHSFLYGFLIRWLTYSSHSLTSLVFFQVLCSSASALLAGYILNRFFSITPGVAAGFSLLCTVAPLQLMYERYVLTETVSLLLFALFFAAALCYLRNPKIKTLLLLSVWGTLLIAFRLSYLPIVIIGAAVVPGLAFFNTHDEPGGSNTESSGMRKTGNRGRIITTCFHVFVSCSVTCGLHYGYKLINGKLSDNPPAYQYSTGFSPHFILGTLA